VSAVERAALTRTLIEQRWQATLATEFGMGLDARGRYAVKGEIRAEVRSYVDAVLAAGWRPPGTDTSDTVRRAIESELGSLRARVSPDYTDGLITAIRIIREVCTP